MSSAIHAFVFAALDAGATATPAINETAASSVTNLNDFFKVLLQRDHPADWSGLVEGMLPTYSGFMSQKRAALSEKNVKF